MGLVCRCFLFNAVLLAFSGFSLQAQQVSNDSLQHRLYDLTPDHYYAYAKPRFWQKIKYIPADIYAFGKFTIQKENLVLDAAVIGSTALLLPFDQQIQDESQRFGDRLGGWDEDHAYSKFLGLNIVPQNINSAVYYVGNGGTTILLSGMFYTISLLDPEDYRARHTSSELIECLIATGIATQTIKRITGRQSPVRANPQGNDGGAWHFFPSFSDYQRDTPNYDAMPSGHLATYVAALMVIAINYPEITWIKPVGYTLGALLALNMVSTKVHWISDYPLGILTGYVIGKTIAERRITKISKNGIGAQPTTFKWNYSMSRLASTSVFGASVTF
ncbi:phosphatase PAP2 family protein [Flavobacterium sp.]|uniref:phosphatase PAP2 family protein n=1 Tax=Flavobacterium sp. TaxID=239 RepID=UPI0039E38701